MRCSLGFSSHRTHAVVTVDGDQAGTVWQNVSLIDLIFAVDGELDHLANDQIAAALLGDSCC
jgi:hypothetical protein